MLAYKQKSPIHINMGLLEIIQINEFVAFTCFLNLKQGSFCKILSRLPSESMNLLFFTKFSSLARSTIHKVITLCSFQSY